MAATDHPAEVVESAGRAMASSVQLILVAPAADARAWATDRLRELESAWSRFLPGSDLSRLASAEGEWVTVSADTVTLVETMQLAAEITDGRYDPTMVRELIDAGYVDRATSGSLDTGKRVTVSYTIDLPCPGVGIHDVEVDGARSRIRAPLGLALDPGGIGKGLAADLVVAGLLARGTAGALVSIGGDLAMGGRPPVDTGWRVVIDDPFTGGDLVTLDIDAGGVATSSTRSRRWRVATGSTVEERHHVLDPVSRRCSSTDLAAVTVVARSGWRAEAHATAAILAGARGAIDHLHRHGLTGLAVGADGVVQHTADLVVDSPIGPDQGPGGRAHDHDDAGRSGLAHMEVAAR